MKIDRITEVEDFFWSYVSCGTVYTEPERLAFLHTILQIIANCQDIRVSIERRHLPV